MRPASSVGMVGPRWWISARSALKTSRPWGRQRLPRPPRACSRKWACRCCQTLVQEPVAPQQVVDKGQPTAGLVAHTLVSRFVDHVPYYRQEQINARSGVHTPRSTLASWAGAGGATLAPLYEALRKFVLSARVLHADETPVAMLDPGAGKTRKAYVWAYARGAFDPIPAVGRPHSRGSRARNIITALPSVPSAATRGDCQAAARSRQEDFGERDPQGSRGARRMQPPVPALSA